jgi:hypothetical protein
MKKRKLYSSDNAVVGIVVAVLLIGLVVSVVALIQTQYVPKWMEEKESEHMEEVIDQFTRLKFAIDTQIATNQTGSSIASTIKLGSKELPFLLSQRSYGQLTILSNILSDNNHGCVFETRINGVNKIYPLGSIIYSSANAYYLDQSFIYEAGAIITDQPDDDKGNDMTIKPSFSFENNKLKINLVSVSIEGGKSNGGGYSSTAIMTEYNGQSVNNLTLITNTGDQIIITSNYAHAWKEFMESLLSKTLQEPQGNVLTIPLNSGELVLNEYKIDAQIGPGWVE